ncbi:MAG: SMP-30/gluconolactonase/LRE family protein [SAR86 cluster bacterium]|nr:SMP-30/gluconolactonase/LRE family protein [SAR86 cluster bacterium]
MMTKESKILASGLTFPEGPRWHDNKLYFSDFFTHKVMALDLSGNLETILEIDDQPSGLGWSNDGSLMIVSMTKRKLLCFSNGNIIELADCSNLANFHCNDMVVDIHGNAYIGNFGFDMSAGEGLTATNMILVRPGEEPCIAADELFFPNGTVISPDGKILIVGETYAARLTAFDINLDATLSNRRIWADLSKIRENYFPVPDGICLDEEGAIWVASPTTNEVIRVEEGGKILETITVKNNAYACMLGGEDRKTLFICTSNGTDEKSCKEDRGGCIETAEVDIAGCGHP